MSSRLSLTGQPQPHPNRNPAKKALKTILVLVFVFVIVVLLTLAVILSGRTGIPPMQTPSPTPTKTPTTAQGATSSVIVFSVGLLQPYYPDVRLGLNAAKKGDWQRT